MSVMGLMIVWLGLYPQPVLTVVRPVIEAVGPPGGAPGVPGARARRFCSAQPVCGQTPRRGEKP